MVKMYDLTKNEVSSPNRQTGRHTHAPRKHYLPAHAGGKMSCFQATMLRMMTTKSYTDECHLNEIPKIIEHFLEKATFFQITLGNL